MATLKIHKAETSPGRGSPTYADRAGAGYTTKLVVGTSASSAIDVSAANIVRIFNKGDISDDGVLFMATGLVGVGAPTTGDFYPIKAGEIAYIGLDTGDTHIRMIGDTAAMDVWYSLVG